MVKKVLSVLFVFVFLLGTFSSAYALDSAPQTPPPSECGCCASGVEITDTTLDQAKQASGLDSILVLPTVAAKEFIAQHVVSEDSFVSFLAQQSILVEGLKNYKVIEIVEEGVTSYTFSIETDSEYASLSGKINEHGQLQSLQLVQLKDNMNIDQPETIGFEIIDSQEGTSEISLRELTLLKLNAVSKLGQFDGDITTLDIDWTYWGCSLSGSLACPVACLVFAALPPVMAACNIGCKAAWQLGLCSKS